ncbi:MAG: restriction endonuclease subunit R [Acidobacteria bacterium]|nr:restriction endonuclease subunit R [Acidobacteriota bacterium]
MNEKLSELFNRIKSDGNLLTVNEAQTSQGIVLPILHNLGWNVFDTTEVTPEYAVSGGRVDFALRIQAVNKVFLEIKKTSENLDNHQQQLVYYAFQQGVKLAILTNGITWQFYLPLEEGSWEQRRFFTIDLMQQTIEDAIEKFEVLLSRNSVESGNAYQSAKSLFEGRQKNKIIRENLPKAWQKLISEPDEMLVELLNETLEKMCGYQAENKQITEFLQGLFPDVPVGVPVLKKKDIAAESSSLKSGKKLQKSSDTQNDQTALKLDPENIENLAFTKVIEARFGISTAENSWRDLLDVGLRTALKKGLSISEIKDLLSLNIKEGIHKTQGFCPIKGEKCSRQYQDANKTMINAVKLAKSLKCEIYVLFEWQAKGKFPMQKGLIHWRP